jgi:hypothetical protein
MFLIKKCPFGGVLPERLELTMRVLEPKRPAPEVSGDGPKVRIGQRRGPLPIPRRLTVILGFFAPDTMSRSA